MTDENSDDISPDRRFFAERILDLRRENGLTQVQLAELSGVSQAHVSALERGVWEPRFDTILAFARAFRVQPASLLPTIEV
jgi:transcriptional regulator with XRE-family HTH domain